jgi:type IV pilus assembly protein PilP
MNFTHKFGFIVVFFMSVFLLFACDGSQPFKDLRGYIDNLKQAKIQPDTAELASTQEELAPASVKYESSTRRSPFEVLEAVPATKGTTSTNPLQAYPLDMLRFVGTVTQNDQTIAFVSAPDNKIYQVKAGDILGDSHGEVVSIEPDRITLTELYTDNGNAALKRVVNLQLKEVSQ